MIARFSRLPALFFSFALLCAGSAQADNLALQLERQTAGTATSGNTVIFDSVIFSAGNVSYDSVTGVITFNEAGRYVIHHTVTYQAVTGYPAVATTALSSSQGDFIAASSIAPNGQVAGFGIIEVTAAPVTLALVNAAPGTLVYSPDVPVKASLMVIQDDLVISGP